MQALFLFSLACLLTAPVWAQKPRFQIHAETPEGQLLQKAGQADGDAAKIALYEEFLAKYPKHDGVVYAWTQLQPLLLQAKQFDKVIAGAETILAAEPQNTHAAYNALQACEQKTDVLCVITWAGRTTAAAKLVQESKKPQEDDEAEAWTREVDFAKQVGARCEYACYASSLQATDPKHIMALYEALEKMNPESQYIAAAGSRYLVALLQLKEVAKAQQFAEKAAERNQASDDTLLFAADASLSTSKNYDKAIAYAGKVTSALPAQPAPPGMSPADWETRKKNSLGRAWWIAGAAEGAKSNWLASEKSMLAALPMLENNPAGKDLLPGAYFYLGLANYSLSKAAAKPDAKRRAEAVKYFNACAAIRSPFQAQAQKNLAVIAAGK